MLRRLIRNWYLENDLENRNKLTARQRTLLLNSEHEAKINVED